MKFLIVAFHPRSMTPYAKQYENAIIKAGYRYDILFWDRFSNAPLEKRANEFIFHKVCTLGGNRLKKIYPFYLFRKVVKNIINKGNYNKIIILNTMPGFLLHDILLKKYSNKYIFDIRDYTYEKYKPYLHVVQHLIDQSFFTTISSRGFKKFLGENHKIIVNHNISNEENILDRPTLSRNKQDIIIGFVGAVRYFNENLALIKSVQTSSRFRLTFAGRQNSDCPLKEECEENNYRNVSFSGAFTNDEKPNLYKNIDMINSVFGNQSLDVITLLPNRLYDALIFKKPIIATKGTYLAEVVSKNNLGPVLDDSRGYTAEAYQQELAAYVDNFLPEEFIKNANQLLDNVKKEQQVFHEKIAEFVNQ
ncbi:glycosyltransferase [Megasphaera elsdenii]|jgi:hypothetical protein|uniref:glycosyltransferase n=1 Tax=Megasphaera elsdenii TaxID=907 RepID=UPI000BA5DB46|nr:glycosyltransferase [Megasphaera elsdenii]MCI7200263.1 glycosyltransferase [Megasphaera elsdenii]MDY4264152.1 glycosyltransferase [Megasphaera elsdenii]PAK20799.1 hypothetical protein CJO36_01135 [Megasphaera elsdenii]